MTRLRRLTGSARVVAQMWRMMPGPSMSQRTTFSPGARSFAGDPFRPGPRLEAAFPPSPLAPVGFSKE